MPSAPPRLKQPAGNRASAKACEKLPALKRQTSAKRGYGRAWQRARIGFLRKHPLCECEDCQAGIKRVMAAIVVDHIIPHKGDKKLFWDRNNWQAMSASCHSRKTAKTDGGFGHKMHTR